MKKLILTCIFGVLCNAVQAILIVTDDFNRPNTPAGSCASNVTQVATAIRADWKPVTQSNGVYTTQYKIINNSLGFGIMATNVQKGLLINSAARTLNAGTGASFTLSATLKDVVGGGATMGVVFNYQDDGNYYVFRVSPNAGVYMLCYSNFIQQATPISTTNGAIPYVKGNAYTFTVHSDNPYTFSMSIADTISGISIYTTNLTLGVSAVKHQDGLGGVFNNSSAATVDNFRLETVPASTIVLDDNFSFGGGMRAGIVAGTTKLDDQAVQIGIGTWQNEYNGTNEMNEFVFGTNGAVVCAGKTSAHNYVPYDFTLLRTIITASADFKMSAESKTAANTLWVVGLWETIDQPNLWSITNGDIMTARFWPAGSSEGRLQIWGRGNNLIESRSADGVKFSPTDTIRISVSYDKITGEWFATAYNLTSNAPMTSVKYIKPGIIDLHYAGFGITSTTGATAVQNFKVSSSHKSSQLITDNAVQAGVTVMDPMIPGAVNGALQYTTSFGSPVWTLSQWNSHGTIYGVTPTLLASGAYIWSNQYKAVTMGPSNTSGSDIILAIDSVAEFGGRFRTTPHTNDWPHLMVNQSISGSAGKFGENSPWLDELTALEFSVELKLLQAENNHTSDAYGNSFNPNMHCSEFYIGITPQNLNTHSSDSNKLIAFGMFFYKDLNPFPTNCYFSMNPDPATNGLGYTPMIYQIGMPFSTNGLQIGQWRTIHGDILPYIKQAFDYAHSHGCLTNSTLADFKISTVGLNWEVMGLSRVSMQVKNFALKAVGLAFPPSYEFNTDGDKEGWSSVHLPAGGPANGAWVFTASENDPQLIGPAIRVDAAAFNKVKVGMFNNTVTSTNCFATLFWKHSGSSVFTNTFGGTCFKKIPIGSDSNWVEYTFDMTDNTNWDGEITQLRLDPILNGDGHAIGIDYIRFD